MADQAGTTDQAGMEDAVGAAGTADGGTAADPVGGTARIDPLEARARAEISSLNRRVQYFMRVSPMVSGLIMVIPLIFLILSSIMSASEKGFGRRLDPSALVILAVYLAVVTPYIIVFAAMLNRQLTGNLMRETGHGTPCAGLEAALLQEIAGDLAARTSYDRFQLAVFEHPAPNCAVYYLPPPSRSHIWATSGLAHAGLDRDELSAVLAQAMSRLMLAEQQTSALRRPTWLTGRNGVPGAASEALVSFRLSAIFPILYILVFLRGIFLVSGWLYLLFLFAALGLYILFTNLINLRILRLTSSMCDFNAARITGDLAALCGAIRKVSAYHHSHPREKSPFLSYISDGMLFASPGPSRMRREPDPDSLRVARLREALAVRAPARTAASGWE